MSSGKNSEEGQGGELEREFSYNDENFFFLQKMAKVLAGIVLSDLKKDMVYSRVSRILRRKNFKTFDEYCHYLKQGDAQAINEFISAIITNHTGFMRESHHFNFLKHNVLPDILKNNSSKRIRIWSAGSASGEEAYSISFIVKKFFERMPGWDIKILATDIDPNILEKGRVGRYFLQDVEPHFDSKQLKQYFKKMETEYIVQDAFKSVVYFKEFNFLETNWPMKGPFDVIFCRNVMIYFDKKAQQKLFDNFAKLLRPGGYLIVGHSEVAPPQHPTLHFLSDTIYQHRP